MGFFDRLIGITDRSQKLPIILVHRIGPVPIPFVFPLNPQMEDVTWRSRTQIQQTLDDNVLSDFSGPRALTPRVRLRGTFGYKTKGLGIGLPMPGSAHLRTLEGIYETFNSLNRELKAHAGADQTYINPGHLHLWRVTIDSLGVRRSDQSPLLWTFELQMTRLEDYLSPGGSRLTSAIATTATDLLGKLRGAVAA